MHKFSIIIYEFGGEIVLSNFVFHFTRCWTVAFVLRWFLAKAVFATKKVGCIVVIFHVQTIISKHIINRMFSLVCHSKQTDRLTIF